MPETHEALLEAIAGELQTISSRLADLNDILVQLVTSIDRR